MASDEPYPPAHDLSAYRRHRQSQADESLIVLFSVVLGKPLELRELTPEQQARREDRLRARKRLRP
jgi:hypothetical protein